MTVAANGAAPLYESDEQRWAQRRGQYLRRQYGLDARVAEALAWSELGYSASGAAKAIGAAEATVQSYFEAVEEEHGRAAVLARRRDELGVDEPLRAPSMAGGDE